MQKYRQSSSLLSTRTAKLRFEILQLVQYPHDGGLAFGFVWKMEHAIMINIVNIKLAAPPRIAAIGMLPERVL